MHTPGPWKNDSMEFTAGYRCVVNMPNGRSVDVADPRDRKTDQEDVANARLIAAAPVMLDLMKKHLKDSGCDGDLCNWAWHEEFRQIIRQVEEGE